VKEHYRLKIIYQKLHITINEPGKNGYMKKFIYMHCKGVYEKMYLRQIHAIQERDGRTYFQWEVDLDNTNESRKRK
jgi:hypothetical protein